MEYQIDLDTFRGPLDLLLFLVKRQEVDIRDIPIARVTSQMIEDYRDRRLKTSQPSTVRQDLAALADCLKWAVKLHYVHKNPCEGVEKPSLPGFVPRANIIGKPFSIYFSAATRDQPESGKIRWKRVFASIK